MKKLLTVFLAALTVGSMGCEEEYQVPTNTVVNVRSVEWCDVDYGCRTISDVPVYYDSEGVMWYWDVHFGIWVGPRGYYSKNVFYRGFYPGYHSWYHHGFYHPHGTYGFHNGGTYNRGGFRAGRR